MVEMAVAATAVEVKEEAATAVVATVAVATAAAGNCQPGLSCP